MSTFTPVRCQASQVSILVFVELALDAYRTTLWKRRMSSFNPCFRGTCSWCAGCWSFSSHVYPVSILVFVELALDGPRRSRPLGGLGVSILVFVELALDGLAAILALIDHESFNPCFRGTCSWCIIWKESMWLKMSFNPCFRGTCSWCQYEEDYLEYLTKFQSLFSWNLLLMNICEKCDGSGQIEFQSLFSWNLLLMCNACQMLCTVVTSFNPCFRGTCSWWKLMSTDGRFVRSGFNPCFRGTCSWWVERAADECWVS